MCPLRIPRLEEEEEEEKEEEGGGRAVGRHEPLQPPHLRMTCPLCSAPHAEEEEEEEEEEEVRVHPPTHPPTRPT